MEFAVSKIKELGDMDREELIELLKDRNMQYGILAGTAGVYVLYRLLSPSKYNLPPGPRGWPLLGHALSMQNMSYVHKMFPEWKRRYGDVFTIRLGPKPCIILASSSAMQEAFIKKGNEFAGRVTTPSIDLFTMDGKSVFSGQPGPVWKLQRMIAHAALRKYASGKQLENASITSFESFSAALEETEGRPFEIPETMLRLTYNILATISFGRKFGMDDPWLNNFIAEFKRATKEFGNGLISDFVPALQFLDKNKIRILKEFMDRLMELFTGEVEKHKQNFDPNDPRDLTDEVLLQVHKQEKDPNPDSALKQLSFEHLLMILFDMFTAGTDTTRITLSMLIGYMVKYPDIQTKVQQELDSVLGESGNVSLKLRDELPYTNAVLHEVLRIQPVTPLGAPHQTTCDVPFRGFNIPKGTMVMPYVYGIQHDPENFPDPNEFKPERWIDANGKFQSHPYHFVIFSMGPRVCVGEAIARSNLHFMTSLILHKFRFSLPEGTDPSSFELPLQNVMFGVDVNPYKVVATKRH